MEELICICVGISLSFETKIKILNGVKEFLMNNFIFKVIKFENGQKLHHKSLQYNNIIILLLIRNFDKIMCS